MIYPISPITSRIGWLSQFQEYRIGRTTPRFLSHPFPPTNRVGVLLLVRLEGFEPSRYSYQGIFLPHYVTITAYKGLWSGLSLHLAFLFRCVPSSLYTFPKRASLGIVLIGVSPNLTRFT